jgi:predicted AlkP superfamily phosphohydrolase/phosphomutase
VNPGGVLVIGLDGGTWDILRPLAERGLMPTMARVLDQGASGVLRSTVPWYTVPGWVSLMTGVTPARHGLLYWTVPPVEDYWEGKRAGRRFVQSTDIPFPTFWDVAGAAGKRVAVANMPMTFPAWPVEGTMVTGLLTPAGASARAAHPEGLLDSYPEYEIDLAVSWGGGTPEEIPDRPPSAESTLDDLLRVTPLRRRLFLDLVRAEVDLAVAVFVGPDRIGHRAWGEQTRIVAGEDPASVGPIGERVADYYRLLDGIIGDLVEEAGPSAVTLFVSDHGFGDSVGRRFWVNAWLRDRGFLKVRAARVQGAIVRRKRLRNALRPVLKPLRGKRSRPADHALFSMSQSAAYAVPFPSCRVFGVVINREGTKREGCVAPDRVVPLRDEIARGLLEVRDPEDNGNVIRHVWTRDELGAEEGAAFPDLMVEVAAPWFPGDGVREPNLFRTPRRTGAALHDRDGLLAAIGPGVRPGTGVVADIEDVAPTVLAALGVAAPAHIQGRALSELLQFAERLVPAPANVPPPGEQVAPISDEDREGIESQLRALGYLD